MFGKSVVSKRTSGTQLKHDLTPVPVYADMINIFEVFLPQLLRYPNPNDPLNGDAAALLMRHPKDYEAKVKGPFYPLPHPHIASG